MTEPEAGDRTRPSAAVPAPQLPVPQSPFIQPPLIQESADGPPPVPRPPAKAFPLLLTLALGLLAYLLTPDTGVLGLNTVLVVLALMLGLLLAPRPRPTPLHPAPLVLFGFGLLCAVGLTLRDGTLVTGLNVLGLLAALSLGAAYLRVPGLTRLSVGGMLLAVCWAWARGLYGLPASASRFPWSGLKRLKTLNTRIHNAQLRRTLTGLLLTLPLLLIFGWLLSGADARFGALISRLFDWNLPAWNLNDLTFAALQFAFWAFLLGGPVYAALLAGRAAPPPGVTHTPTLGLTELGIPLLSVSALFCVYLGVQAQTFFGHQLASGLTYSESVRRGFGELTAVAALTLMVLLLTHTLLRRDLRRTLAYRLLSLAVLLPLSLLIVSACVRLELYVTAYGLSEVRVLGGVFLAWVALSLLVYAALLWRGGLERFAYLSLVSGLGLIVGLNGVNPGRLIAGVNLSRAAATSPGTDMMRATLFQIADLGADAAPALIAHLGRRQPDARTPDADTLCTLARFLPESQPDWRMWNLARRHAAALVDQLQLSNPQVNWGDCQAASYD